MTCFFHLRRLRQVRCLLGRDVTANLVSAFVLSQLDYSNALLAGLRMPPLHHYSASSMLPWDLCMAYDHASQPQRSSCTGCRSRHVYSKSYAFSLEMWEEIFMFESFINFVNFLKYFKTPFFEIFIEILYFNYNSPITRKNVSQV